MYRCDVFLFGKSNSAKYLGQLYHMLHFSVNDTLTFTYTYALSLSSSLCVAVCYLHTQLNCSTVHRASIVLQVCMRVWVCVCMLNFVCLLCLLVFNELMKVILCMCVCVVLVLVYWWWYCIYFDKIAVVFRRKTQLTGESVFLFFCFFSHLTRVLSSLMAVRTHFNTEWRGNKIFRSLPLMGYFFFLIHPLGFIFSPFFFLCVFLFVVG